MNGHGVKGRVTVLTTVHTPDDPRIRYKTAASLASAGWRVTYVCRDPGPSDATGLDVIALRGGRIARLIGSARIMAATSSDVVAVHDPELLVPALPIAMMRRSTRFVFDLHENLPLQLASRTRTPRWLRGLTASMSRAVLRWADRAIVVTVAEPGYRELFDSDPRVFPNYPVAQTLPRRAADATGVVYVGDITEARGAVVLAEAVGSLDGVALTMIGRCSPDLARRLGQIADRTATPLTLTGFLPYAEAWELARRSLVGVSPLLDRPNYRNSLPTKLIEYRAMGLMVVASDLPGSAAFLEGPSCVVVPPGDAEALAAAIASLIADPTAQQAGLDGIDDVRASYMWDADGFATFYGDLLTHAR